MFTDGRSKKVVFLAHCLLNQNAISDGTAVYPSAFQGLIRFFLDNDVGIVQLPCPELCCLGLDRGNVLGAQSPVTVENTRIRAAMGAPGPARASRAPSSAGGTPASSRAPAAARRGRGEAPAGKGRTSSCCSTGGPARGRSSR